MEYPKLPEELDNRRKLTSAQIEEIRKLYKAGGWTHRSLGVEYGVSKTMIRYYVVEPEKRDEINKKRYERMAQQKIDNPEFAKKHRQQTIKSYVEGYKKLEARRVYKAKGTYKWKKKKYHTDAEFRQKTILQSREPSRIRSYQKWHTNPLYREYQNEKNKQNYIKRMLGVLFN